jgi:hypothetical protein
MKWDINEGYRSTFRQLSTDHPSASFSRPPARKPLLAPLLSFFYSEVSSVGAASPSGDIKTPLPGGE